ncbi:unnamed protein product [Darwinula stevensoni]|uniref:C2H2-type domain-containing protein n=1 Tax=Darwinula stevensoni TaxID=69355 RepID=A0A7R9FSB0_9CRUS|nr:unnamed protein product [Darwinula stevensoni]CAG0902256.1 unnamed protein product [Darwinula stevensoni]
MPYESPDGVYCRRCVPPRWFSSKRQIYEHGIHDHDQKPLERKKKAKRSVAASDTALLRSPSTRPRPSASTRRDAERMRRRRICSHCGKDFPSYDSHRFHLYSRHGDEKSGCPCLDCGEWFSRNKFLADHRPNCPQLLLRDGKLLDAELQFLECSRCDKPFKKVSTLIRHKKYLSHFHGDETVVAPPITPSQKPTDNPNVKKQWEDKFQNFTSEWNDRVGPHPQ